MLARGAYCSLFFFDWPPCCLPKVTLQGTGSARAPMDACSERHGRALQSRSLRVHSVRSLCAWFLFLT
jgi:hypothetical protein